jgi:hypothetical protein
MEDAYHLFFVCKKYTTARQFLTQVMIFFCNAGCLYHPIKHQRKHFIIQVSSLYGNFINYIVMGEENPSF